MGFVLVVESAGEIETPAELVDGDVGELAEEATSDEDWRVGEDRVDEGNEGGHEDESDFAARRIAGLQMWSVR